MKTYEFFRCGEKLKNSGLLKYANCNKTPLKSKITIARCRRNDKRATKAKEMKNVFITV